MKRFHVLMMAIAMLFGQAVPAQTLKVYLPFNGNTADESGNNNHPTYVGARLTSTADRFGQPATAFAFDGAVGSYMRLPADLLPEGNRTVSMWFRAAQVSNRPVLLSYGGNSVNAPGSSFFMGLNLSGSSAYQISGHYGSNNLEHQYPAPPVNEWFHWVVTIDGNSQRSFINGQQVAVGGFSSPTFVTGKDLALGVATNTTGIAPYTDFNVGYFQGSLDEVKIYDGALTAAQVLALYTLESIPPNTGFYYVNDNSTTGDALTSAVGNDGNPGTAAAPFATIQQAVNVATQGGTIYVDAGNYVEQVTIDKGLTITGAGRTKTYVTLPATTAPAPGAFTEMGTFQTIQNIGDVHLTDLSITGRLIAGQETITPVIIQSGGSVRNASLQGGNQGVFFRVESSVKNALVENSVIDAEYVGVNFSGLALTASMINNQVTLHNPFFSAGVFASDNFMASGNDIRGFYTFGIQAGNNNTINNNSITGAAGLAIQAGVPVNASCNWFGTADGSAITLMVSPGVTFTPWLSDGTDADPASAGFQPMVGACNAALNLYVNDNSTTGDIFTTAIGNDANEGSAASPFATIQKAVQVSPPGSTIYVDAGNYEEQVTIDKGLTIIGGGAAKTFVTLPANTAPAPGSFTEMGTFQTTQNIGDVHLSDISITGRWIEGQEAITPVIIQAGGSVRNANLQGGNQGIFFRVESAMKNALVENSVIDAEYVGVNFSGEHLTSSLVNNLVTLHNASFSAGVFGSNNFTATGNDIRGFYTFGIQAGINNTINNNSITGAAGLAIQAAVPVNATCNWFGTSLGSLIETKVSPGVISTPWLTNGLDADAVAGGFQPLPDICNGTPIITTLLSSTNINCFAGNNGAADVNIDGGVQPFIFAWSKDGDAIFSQDAEDLMNATAGIYTLLVTDATGATATLNVNLSEPAELQAALTGTNVNCFGGHNGSATVTATGGTGEYAFLWSNSNTTSAANGLLAGIYTVTVTDENGCTVQGSYTVTEPAELRPPNVRVTNISCNGLQDGRLALTGRGGTAPYRFSIDGLIYEEVSVFTGLAAGTYNLYVKDANDCLAVGQATISEPATLEVVVENVINTCAGLNSGAINLKIMGGTPKYSIAWVGPGGYSSSKEDINSLAIGEYMVTVTDLNGCVFTATALIETEMLPIINGEVSPVSCYNGSNGSINLQIPPASPLFTFAWTGPNGYKSSVEDITGLKAGSYNLTLTSSGGCTIVKTFEVAAALPLSISATDVEITNCERNETIVATGIGGKAPYRYSLNGGQLQSEGTFANLAPGKYTLMVTDDNGCVYTDNDVNIVDNGSDAYEANNTIGAARPVTFGSPLQARLFSSKSADADWYVFSVQTSGLYNLNWSHPIAQQSFGVYTLNKNKALALAEVGSGAGYKSYNLTAGVDYYIGVTGTQSLDCYTLDIQYLNNQRRMVQSQEPKELFVNVDGLKATAYPNPHRGAINIRIESPVVGKGDLLFYDFTGKLVKSRQVNLQQGNNSIRIDDLPPVSMIYTVKVGGQAVSGKVIGID